MVSLTHMVYYCSWNQARISEVNSSLGNSPTTVSKWGKMQLSCLLILCFLKLHCMFWLLNTKELGGIKENNISSSAGPYILFNILQRRFHQLYVTFSKLLRGKLHVPQPVRNERYNQRKWACITAVSLFVWFCFLNAHYISTSGCSLRHA